MRKIGWQAGLLVAAIGLPFTVTLVPVASPPPQAAVTLPTDQTSVCAVSEAKNSVYALGESEITATPIGADPQDPQPKLVLPDLSVPVVLKSAKRFAAGTRTVTDAASGWSRCSQPRTSGFLALAQPRSSDLLLVNPDDAEAAVELTLFGPEGPVSAIGSQTFSLSARSTRVVPVSAFVASDAPTGVGIQASLGRVGVFGRTWSALSGDYAEATSPAASQLLPGIPAGVTSARVVVTNPGPERAKVSVEALSTQAIALADAQAIPVEPLSTVSIDISATIGEDAAALRVTADRPVVAAASVGGDGDFALVSHAEPLTSGRAVLSGGGQVSVTNPSDAPVTVRLAISSGENEAAPVEATIEAGQTSVWPGAEADVVSYDLLSSAPVIAAVSLFGEKSTYVVPFQPLAEIPGTDVTLNYDPRLR